MCQKSNTGIQKKKGISKKNKKLETRADNTFKYNVFAPMRRFQLELIYLYFPPSFYQTVDNCQLSMAGDRRN